MGGVRAVMFGLPAALALSGCMGQFVPVASAGSGASRFVVPLGTSLGRGDTVFVGERWF